MATGDLNQDGFPDLVTVSNFDLGDAPMVQYGGADPEVYFFSPSSTRPRSSRPVFTDLNAEEVGTFQLFQYNGITHPDGTLAVELNSGDNGNKWVAVKLRGTVDVAGSASRDGIGATIQVTPRHGETAMAPVLGGSSHLSQHSLTQTFGLGDSATATVDILWPGGTRNRHYNVVHGSTLGAVELPCSYDTADDFRTYRRCVRDGLRDLRQAGILDRRSANKMRRSAIRAYWDARQDGHQHDEHWAD